jgi:GTPase SAR1 family protein
MNSKNSHIALDAEIHRTLTSKFKMVKKTKSRILKVLVLGEHNVGKTSLLNRYVADEYSGDYKPTIGVDFGRKDLQINGQNVTMQVI